MRIATLLIAAALTLGMAATEADAAKRFGGGGNLGKQRATPTKDVPASPPASAPTAAPSGAPAAAPAGAAASGAAAAAAKPSFMSRWGGLLAGLGIGALLASMFGASMGPVVGMILMLLLGAVILFFVFRLFANRGSPSAATASGPSAAPGAAPGAGPRAAFSGIGSAVGGGSSLDNAPAAQAPAAAAPAFRADFDVPNFLRQAKTSFIRLQAANDAKDLDDIRSYTTPELYAEIQMQLNERGAAASRTEVVSVDARLLELVQEDGYDIASVRFTGLIREDNANNPEPFDEIWHVKKKVGDRNPAWLIAGIQQVAE